MPKSLTPTSSKIKSSVPPLVVHGIIFLMGGFGLALLANWDFIYSQWMPSDYSLRIRAIIFVAGVVMATIGGAMCFSDIAAEDHQDHNLLSHREKVGLVCLNVSWLAAASLGLLYSVDLLAKKPLHLWGFLNFVLFGAIWLSNFDYLMTSVLKHRQAHAGGTTD